jgi:regulator of sigma E protease
VSYVYAFLGFAALIILHEFGHFLAAKAVGMRVERFSLFFGPLLVRKKWGETEYGIAPIPLGGYVRITGMNPHEDIPPEAVPRAYYNQPVWKRVVVIAAGPAMNLLLAFVIVWALFLSNGQAVVNKQVAAVDAAPASKVLKPGDQIVSVDGVSGSAETIHNAIIKHRCPGPLTNGCEASTAAHVVVRRDGHLLTFNIKPRYNASDREMLLGFAFGQKQQSVGVGQGASLAVSELWYVTKATVSAVAHVVNPKPQQRLSSVVGAYKVTQQSFAQDTTRALWVLALISLSLAIINLFPFLPLDGGHIFWAVAEKVRGKRIPFEVMERASAAGFILIIIIFVIGLTNDISTLSGSGFNVH